VHNDLNWDWQTFDLDRDTELVDTKAGFINAIQTNLTAFKARGGKLLLYHGWNDPLIAPQNTINYYSNVLATMGPSQDEWLRLFMAPGMGHCRGGPGPDQMNLVGALERWRESGVAPNEITAYHVENNHMKMTRPLCPYPQIAHHSGVGSTNDAENFSCKAP
jgi:feruloyl esterase